jgi:signal transduction histidine kinase
VERTLDLSSQELLAANSQMQTLLQTVEAQVVERTTQLTQSNAELEQTLHELRQTQTQLVQTEKMSSLGQLVAGVAHEINNPVSFIHGNLTYANQSVRSLVHLLHLYQQHYPTPVTEIQDELADLDLSFVIEDLYKMFISMQSGADRIKQIVLALRNFSRHDESAMKPVHLEEGIESTLQLLQHRLIPAADSGLPTIQVFKNYGSLPKIACYAGQLNQVLMHLLNNAIDALLEDPKREQSNYRPSIWIETRLNENHSAEIRIADNGIGIAPTHQRRLFDPFFTTKPVGAGTGLSLSIAYQIITQQHQGKLECRSTPGNGTEFCITIPTEASLELTQDLPRTA